MAKPPPVSAITALPPSPQQDRQSRMKKYVLAMSLRVFCILMCFFVQGWWLLAFAIGAIVLPYLAVVLANVGNEPGGNVLRPGSLEPVRARQRPLIPDEDPVAPGEADGSTDRSDRDGSDSATDGSGSTANGSGFTAGGVRFDADGARFDSGDTRSGPGRASSDTDDTRLGFDGSGDPSAR